MKKIVDAIENAILEFGMDKVNDNTTVTITGEYAEVFDSEFDTFTKADKTTTAIALCEYDEDHGYIPNRELIWDFVKNGF